MITLRQLLDRTRRWLSAMLGLAAATLGLVILTRPLASLSSLALLIALSLLASGTAELVRSQTSPTPRLTTAISVAWIIAGAGVLVWPALTFRALVLVVGIALIASGVARGAGAIRPGSLDQRITAGLSGLAGVIFGGLALAWPDVTLLIIAVVFGARTIWFGITHTWSVLRARPTAPEPESDPASRAWWRRWAQTLGALATLAVAAALALVSAQVHDASPAIDEFYTAPSSLPSEPGVLIRSEPFTRDVPDDAEAWRILYSTTRDDQIPALASALVVVPRGVPESPRPVIAWAHGTTGYAPNCAPSLAAEPFVSGALFVLDEVIEHGWALIATDYPGLGTAGPQPYLIGQGQARSVLDAVRAARALDDISLSEQTVVWGHSQGGHAALWTGIVAPTYAPDVDVVGVAALAPASDLTALVDSLPTITGGSVFISFVIAAYTETYPDVRLGAYVRPPAQVLLRRMSTRCLAEPGVLVSVLTALSLTRDPDFMTADPRTGALGERLIENTPTEMISAPLLIGQGLADSLILPSVQDEYVAGRCADGQALDFRTYEARNHIGLVQPDSPLIPELVEWTQDRFDGEPAGATCVGI